MDLPKASVDRVIKENLPTGHIVAKQTRKAFNKAATLFIQYITTIASDVASETKGKNKTHKIKPEHIIQALDDMEFSSLAEQLNSPLGKRTPASRS